MKTYKIKIIDLRKLYLLVLLGVIISIPILITLISATVFLFPKFDSINLFILIYSILIGNLIFKVSSNKSSKLIEVKINKTKLEIDTKTFLLETIDKIKINNHFFNYYPKLNVCFSQNKKITYRINKNEKDFWKFLDNLEEITINGRKIM